MMKQRSMTRGWLTVMGGKLPAQVETISRGWIERGEAPERKGNKIDLFHVDSAVSAGRKMQADPGFGQEWKVVVQILRSSICDIAASQSIVDPL
jgi:hypothetical protein